jgi:hypothetical protein
MARPGPWLLRDIFGVEAFAKIEYVVVGDSPDNDKVFAHLKDLPAIPGRMVFSGVGVSFRLYFRKGG